MKIRWVGIVALSASMLACSQTPDSTGGGGEDADSLTECVDPRPEICTMDYRPVCGQTSDGAKKLFSNGCGACADASIASYRPGLCEAPE